MAVNAELPIRIPPISIDAANTCALACCDVCCALLSSAKSPTRPPASAMNTPTKSAPVSSTSSPRTARKPRTPRSLAVSTFPAERVALRRQGELVLTDEVMLLAETARETFRRSVKKEQDDRTREERMASQYEVPIPSSKTAGKRPQRRVADPMATPRASPPRDSDLAQVVRVDISQFDASRRVILPGHHTSISKYQSKRSLS